MWMYEGVQLADGRRPSHRARSPFESKTVPTTADVETIAAGTEPVLRNLRITQSYHELAQATAALTGSGANWCAFATWASRQAGLTIRGEENETRGGIPFL